MNQNILPRIALTSAILFGAAGAVQAEDQAKQSGADAGSIDQVSLANRLASLGDQRNDPLLLIAAAQIQKTINADAIRPTDKSLETGEILKRAKALSKDRKDLQGLADDVEAQTSKGYTTNAVTGQTTYSYGSGYSYGNSAWR